MLRVGLVVCALAVLPGSGVCQPLTPLTTASGVGGFGGGVRPQTPTLVAPNVNPRLGPGLGLGGGFVRPCPPLPDGPRFGFWLGGWSVIYPYPYFVAPHATLPAPRPLSTANGPSTLPPITLSNEFPAVLIVEFPTEAELWVNGEPAEGGPAVEWTLTSPLLKPGGEYTFELKARWRQDGRTFEYQRSITVGGGQRSRALVLSGTEPEPQE